MKIDFGMWIRNISTKIFFNHFNKATILHLRFLLIMYSFWLFSFIFKVVVPTQLMANKNQQQKITKYFYNVKREVTHKVIHPESLSKMLHILGILTDHIATSQLNIIKSQVTGDYIMLKNTNKNKNYMEIGSKCATFYMSYTHSQYLQFS